jgi:ATP-dependent exoDNAse (exonuclease V) beta subunit
MIWNNKFNYPKSSRSIEDGLRKYLFNDIKLPSVTSILQSTKSEEDKASLENWMQRVGYVEAKRIKNEASNRGTSMHSYIEDFLKGRINESFFESNENYKNMAKEIIEKGIKGKLEEIYGIETTLHYPEKYAGTADLVGVYQGKEVIIDFKQANKPKKVDYIQDYFLQLGAYTLAHNVVYKTNITSGVILLCTVDNLFQDFKIEGKELIMYQNLFLGRVKKFNELKNLP